jgi:hypothetical protein
MKKIVIILSLAAAYLGTIGIFLFLYNSAIKATEQKYQQIIADQRQRVSTLQARMKNIDEALYPACEYFRLNPYGKLDQAVKDFVPKCDAALSVKADPKICDLLPEDIVKDANCYMVKAINENRVETCDLISEQLPRFVCYADLALKNNDISLCEKIIDEEFIKMYPGQNTPFKEAGCYAKFAIKNNDPRFCDKLLNQYAKESCLSDLAIANNDPAQCDLVDNLGEKSSCISQIAVRKLDGSICLKIDDIWVDIKDECLTFIAGTTGNAGLCASVSDRIDGSVRQKCLDQFKKK